MSESLMKLSKTKVFFHFLSLIFIFNTFFLKKGVRLVIDSKALMVLVGTEMDLVEDDIKSEFVFKNPNAKVFVF